MARAVTETYQHVHVESPAVLPGADAQGLEVDAALVKYPVQGVSNLRAKVITSATFKLRGSAGGTTQEGDRKGVSLAECRAEGQALFQVPWGTLEDQRWEQGHCGKAASATFPARHRP